MPTEGQPVESRRNQPAMPHGNSSSSSATGNGTLTPASPALSAMHTIPWPGTQGAPSFNGSNVSVFLENYEYLAGIAGFTDQEKCVRLPQYCTPLIKEQVQNVVDIQSGWTAFKEALMEEYEKNDDRQLMRERSYLERLARMPRSSFEEIHTFCQQFRGLSKALVERGELDGYTRTTLFLRGIGSLSDKIVSKNKLNKRTLGSADIDSIIKDVLTICESKRFLASINGDQAAETRMTQLAALQTVPHHRNNAGPFGATIEDVSHLNPSLAMQLQKSREPSLFVQNEPLPAAQEPVPVPMPVHAPIPATALKRDADGDYIMRNAWSDKSSDHQMAELTKMFESFSGKFDQLSQDVTSMKTSRANGGGNGNY